MRCCGSRSLWAGLSIWLLLAGSSVGAQTCPCPKYDLPAIVDGADAIFVGKVLSATDDFTEPTPRSAGNWSGATEYQRRLMLEVSTILKGTPPRFVEVTTPAGPCAFMFAVGKTYVVVGTRAGAAIATDMCQANATGAALDSRLAAIRDALKQSD